VEAGPSRIEAVALTATISTTARRSPSPLLDQVTGPIAAFSDDGAYDREDVHDAGAERHPDAAGIVPPRSTAVPSETAGAAPIWRDCHLELMAERGRMRRQKASGYCRRALAGTAISRYKRVIGDALHSRTERRQATEMTIVAGALDRMLALGRPNVACIAQVTRGIGPKVRGGRSVHQGGLGWQRWTEANPFA
jgi:hypothetical protein